MKTVVLFQTTGGMPGEKSHFQLVQDESMNVTAKEIDNNGNQQSVDVYLGECGDIDDNEVQGQILEHLLRL